MKITRPGVNRVNGVMGSRLGPIIRGPRSSISRASEKNAAGDGCGRGGGGGGGEKVSPRECVASNAVIALAAGFLVVVRGPTHIYF
jgi:hypothetical protein